MALKYYHAEPLANSLKSMIPLKEKALAYESVYVDLHKFEQHSDWFVAINPEGQVPVLDHDGTIVTHTTVINEYLEDAFPDDQPDSGPLRPRDPAGAARMRFWNKFVDEHVMNHVSMHGWHRMVRVIASSIEDGKFEELMSHIPLPDQRKKWMTARSGFAQKDLDNALEKIEYALDKIERQLGETAYLAGDTYGLADINFYAHCGLSVNRMFPQFEVDDKYPNLVRWREAISDRPAVQDALSSEDRTQPGLRTWSGDGRAQLMKARLSLVTLGVGDLERSLAFYRDGLGLPTENYDPEAGVVFFRLNDNMLLAIWPREELAKDAGIAPEGSGFGGFSLAHNVPTKEAVDAVFAEATAAGAKPLKQPGEVFWGGYTAYFADPDGHLWEVAWNPHTDLT